MKSSLKEFFFHLTFCVSIIRSIRHFLCCRFLTTFGRTESPVPRASRRADGGEIFPGRACFPMGRGRSLARRPVSRFSPAFSPLPSRPSCDIFHSPTVRPLPSFQAIASRRPGILDAFPTFCRLTAGRSRSSFTFSWAFPPRFVSHRILFHSVPFPASGGGARLVGGLRWIGAGGFA